MKLIQRNNGVFAIEYRDEGGARKRISLGTRDPVSARNQLREWRMGVHEKQSEVEVADEPKASPKGTEMTVGQALDKCYDTVWVSARSQATLRSNIRLLKGRIGDVPLSKVTYDRLEQLVSEMRGDGYAPASIKRRLETLSKALTMATKWTGKDGKPVLRGRPPMPTIEIQRKTLRILSHEEERQVLELIDRQHEKHPDQNWLRFSRLVQWLLDTGCRLNEALQLERSWIESRTITSPDGFEREVHFLTIPPEVAKSKKPRTIPLTGRCVSLLPLLEADASKGKLFPMRPANCWYKWDTIRTALGIEEVVIHCFRHTCATRLLKGGMDIFRVKEWLGHADIKVTVEHYAHLDSDDLLGGLNILGPNGGFAETKLANPNSPDNRIVRMR